MNLSWKATEDTLFYATFSQGYRPGGFNRGPTPQLAAPVVNAVTGAVTKGAFQWHVPVQYESDTLTNKEIGWKTTFLNKRLQWNGAIYQEDWKNVQTGIFAPQAGFGNLTISVNGPTYKVKGIEMSLIARATQGLTVQGSMSYNKTELVNSPCIASVGVTAETPGNPTPAGQCITQSYVGGLNPIAQVVNVFGVQGDPLANSPKLQANARARYDWSIDNREYYWQIGAVHQASSFSSATSVNRYEMPSWTVWDASLGVTEGAWTVELVGANLTDVNKSVFTSAAQFIVAQVPQRPRTLGLQFGYKFSGQ